jgi:hypothetical protein
LVPILQPGDIVIIDDLGSNKGMAVRYAIDQVGAFLLHRPPYTSDLNPNRVGLRQAQGDAAQNGRSFPRSLVDPPSDKLARNFLSSPISPPSSSPGFN